MFLNKSLTEAPENFCILFFSGALMGEGYEKTGLYYFDSPNLLYDNSRAAIGRDRLRG